MTNERDFDPQSAFLEPLYDMGDLTEAGGGAMKELAGIYIPRSEIGRDRIGLTRQFLEEASHYASQYTNTDYFKALIVNALTRNAIALEAPLILDIGCGSGNTVLPCLDLFDEARVVATDLSPNLLHVLKTHLQSQHVDDRVTLICMDATRNLYRPGCFDFVVGGAILHHLIDPGAAIAAAIYSLKPGGRALFFEPFEAGHAVLRFAYEEILRNVDRGSYLDEKVVHLLNMLVHDVQLRTGTDKSAEVYRQIDDKWLFTRTYLEDVASEAGASDLRIDSIDGPDTPFSEITRTNLRLGAGLGEEAFPPWAWEIMHRYDTNISAELKRDLPTSAAIMITK